MWRPLDRSLLSEWSCLPTGEGQREGLRSRLVPTTSQLAPSSLIRSLLMASRMHHFLGSPCFTCGSLSATFTDSSWTSSCRRVLGCSQKGFLLFLSAGTPFLSDLIQSEISHVSRSWYPTFLQLRLHFCTPGSLATRPCRGRPCPACPVCPALATIARLSSLCPPLEWKLHREVFLFTVVATAPGRVSVLGCSMQRRLITHRYALFQLSLHPKLLWPFTDGPCLEKPLHKSVWQDDIIVSGQACLIDHRQFSMQY